MLKLRKLIKEHTWDREFGDPLPTFEDVMKKHQVNKLKEGWWDSMSDKAQAAYIKKHGEAPNVAGDDDDYDKGPDMDSRDYDMDDDDDKYDKYGQEMGGTPSKSSGEPEDKPFGGDTGKDADIDYVDPDDIDDLPEPEDEKPSDELPDKVDSSQDASELYDKLDSIQDKYSEIGSKWDEKLDKLSSIDVDEITDEQIEEMGEAGREMSRNYKASSITREMMSIDVSDEEGLEEFNDLLSNLNKQSSSPRTGNELIQETLTIDGKQFRRISEGVEKQPKSTYAFSEFYQRFKK